LIAGNLALQLHKRPTELLGIDWSPYENLLIDAEIMIRAFEEAKISSEEDDEEAKPSLLSEIKAKRRRWLYRGLIYG